MEKDELEKYSEAWNNHDIDTIMDYMTDDCVFDTGRGDQRYGTRYQGSEAVRNRCIEVWTDIPDVRFENTHHFVQGNSGCSEWTFVGTTTDGRKMDVDGCDIFTFRHGKISSKRSYLKNKN